MTDYYEKFVEQDLYNALDYIRDTEIPLRKTSQYVWGKKVLIPILTKDGFETKEYELENWYITLPVYRTTTTTLIDAFRTLAIDKEMENINGSTWEDVRKYTCHQLCDWEWLTGEDGRIVRDGKATLVKYAIVLEDEV